MSRLLKDMTLRATLSGNEEIYLSVPSGEAFLDVKTTTSGLAEYAQSFGEKITTNFSGAITVDCNTTNFATKTVEDASGIIINAPINPFDGAEIGIHVMNVSNPAVSAPISWNSIFAGDAGTTLPSHVISYYDSPASAGAGGIFRYSTVTDKWVCKSSFGGPPRILQNYQSSDYVLKMTDAGKEVVNSNENSIPHIFTIPANSGVGSVAFPVGTVVTFINQNGAGDLTITITTDTLRLAGGSSTGDRDLVQNGIATAIKIADTEWLISGPGLT